MENCQAVVPPLFQLKPYQAGACYLFDEDTKIESEILSELLPL
jgi:hypothetical protein